ncbi:hypothetical protein [Paracoccus aminophilus]|nr:hypothetical protein [Paracoccus aminophilus]
MQHHHSEQIRIGARIATMAVAFQAKSKLVDPRTLACAVRRVDEAYGPEHHLAVDLAKFASCFPQLRQSPDALIGAGERLMSSVLRASWPLQLERADIYG